MSWVPPRGVRRLVVDPLWLPLAVLFAALLAVVMLVAGLAAPFTRRQRVLRIAAFAAVYLYLDVQLLLFALWLWLRSPSPHRDVRTWRAQHARVLGEALSTLIAVARSLFGYQVELVGRDLRIH